MEQFIYSSVFAELVRYVQSSPNQVLVRSGQYKCCSVNIKINWDYSGMHEISLRKNIKCIFWIKAKTDNYELLSKHSSMLAKERSREERNK